MNTHVQHLSTPFNHPIKTLQTCLLYTSHNRRFPTFHLDPESPPIPGLPTPLDHQAVLPRSYREKIGRSDKKPPPFLVTRIPVPSSITVRRRGMNRLLAICCETWEISDKVVFERWGMTVMGKKKKGSNMTFFPEITGGEVGLAPLITAWGRTASSLSHQPYLGAALQSSVAIS